MATINGKCHCGAVRFSHPGSPDHATSCNCSICRNRLGKGATGPITWLANEKGFSNVKDYLASLIRGTPEEEI